MQIAVQLFWRQPLRSWALLVIILASFGNNAGLLWYYCGPLLLCSPTTLGHSGGFFGGSCCATGSLLIIMWVSFGNHVGLFCGWCGHFLASLTLVLFGIALLATVAAVRCNISCNTATCTATLQQILQHCNAHCNTATYPATLQHALQCIVSLFYSKRAL